MKKQNADAAVKHTAAFQTVCKQLVKLAYHIMESSKSADERRAAEALKEALQERAEQEELKGALSPLIQYKGEELGFKKGKLMYSKNGKVRPISLAKSLRIWARIELSEVLQDDDCSSWDSAPRIRFLRLVATELDRKGGGR